MSTKMTFKLLEGECIPNKRISTFFQETFLIMTVEDSLLDKELSTVEPT